jgi:hypothetical protein
MVTSTQNQRKYVTKGLRHGTEDMIDAWVVKHCLFHWKIASAIVLFLIVAVSLTATFEAKLVDTTSLLIGECRLSTESPLRCEQSRKRNLRSSSSSVYNAFLRAAFDDADATTSVDECWIGIGTGFRSVSAASGSCAAAAAGVFADLRTTNDTAGVVSRFELQ